MNMKATRDSPVRLIQHKSNIHIKNKMVEEELGFREIQPLVSFVPG